MEVYFENVQEPDEVHTHRRHLELEGLPLRTQNHKSQISYMTILCRYRIVLMTLFIFIVDPADITHLLNFCQPVALEIILFVPTFRNRSV